jgi:cell division protein FtsW
MRRQTTMLLLVVLALVFIGVITIYSVGSMTPLGMGDFKHQLASLTIGVAVMLYLATHFDYHRFSAPFIFRVIVIVSLGLLVAVLIPGIGVRVNGAQRWIRLAGFQFQPSEFAKLAVIILLARKLAENQSHIKEFWRGFVPPAAIAGGFAALILLEKDLGVPVVIVCMSFLMIYVAGARVAYIAGSLMPAVCGMMALIKLSPYRWQRLIAFLDPYTHRDEGGFHLIQSLAAFAHGSYWGVGPGAGEQKLHYLPAAHTDFIFAVWGEEMGLRGTVLVLALFAAFLLLGMRVAKCAPDLFGSLLATGIVSLISLQAAFNMGVTIGLLPTKGLTLPFISYGGTAQIVFLALVGILLNIGLQAEEPEDIREFASVC